MTGASHSTSPLDTIAAAIEGRTTDAFSLLGNDTRLAILLALWDAHDPTRPTSDGSELPLSFTALYDRVDYDDPGNFSYHLEKLKDHFLHKTAQGYALDQSGMKLVRTVIAGTGAENRTIELTEIDWDCWRCGATTAVTYDGGHIRHVCTGCDGLASHDGTDGGLLNELKFDSAGLLYRSTEELVAAAGVATLRHVRTMQRGLCSTCSGVVEGELDWCAEHDSSGLCEHCGQAQATTAFFRCRVWKDYHVIDPRALPVFHPSVVAFYHERGVSVEWHADDLESVKRVLGLMMNGHETELLSSDPLRLAVTVAYEGDELRLTYDETVSVVDVTT